MSLPIERYAAFAIVHTPFPEWGERVWVIGTVGRRPERADFEHFVCRNPNMLAECTVTRILLRWKTRRRLFKWIAARRPDALVGWYGPVVIEGRPNGAGRS